MDPSLFFYCFYYISSCLTHTTPCLYADDTQIYTSSDLGELSNLIHNNLEKIQDWLIDDKLQSHPSKTKAMTICLSNNIDFIRNQIVLNKNPVKFVQPQQYLGITVDKTFDLKITLTIQQKRFTVESII